LHPTFHYETDAILELNDLVQQALDGEDVFEDLEDLVQAMAELYEDFDRRHTRPFLSALLEDAANHSDDPFPHQLSYVLKTGFELFGQGQSALRQFFESESDEAEELERAARLIGDGHDYIYFGIELVKHRIEGQRRDVFVPP
jgi:AcrR family transcriptional regulator